MAFSKSTSVGLTVAEYISLSSEELSRKYFTIADFPAPFLPEIMNFSVVISPRTFI